MDPTSAPESGHAALFHGRGKRVRAGPRGTRRPGGAWPADEHRAAPPAHPEGVAKIFRFL